MPALGQASNVVELALPRPSSAFISLRKVSKKYESSRGDITALDGIDLDVGQGEFVGILGPSGCGKSTLMKCIAGLEDVTAGTIEVAGKRVTSTPADTGIVFQRDLLLDWRTVLDNVLLPAEFRRLDEPKWKPRAMELLRTLGIDDYAHRFPWELSGGMRQRVAISRGLLLDPALLLMDEPFGALDAITRDELNMELERIWERSRKTVLLITHSITEAVFLSDRVIVMDRNPGRVAEIVDIDLRRPRSLAIRETPEFNRYVRQLRSTFESLGIMRKTDV
jgi:NitT/TauT family transport system ATP-binding protein